MEKDKIYKRLKDIREDLDYKQEDIAFQLGVCANTYSKWEKEVDIMPLDRLNQFANLTNCSMDYIAGFTNKKSPSKNIAQLNFQEVGKRLREFRKKDGKTEKEIAELLGTTQSTVSSYENGKTLILSIFAYTLAKHYQISLDFVCGRKETPEIDIENDIEND